MLYRIPHRLLSLRRLYGLRLAMALLLAGHLAPALPAHGAVPAPKILVLNSYHAGYRGSDDIVSGFSRTIRDVIPDADIKVEYLDSKNYSGLAYDLHLLEMLRFKYQKQAFNLILSTDDYAFDLLLKHRDELFGRTPVVFCGTNYFDASRITARPDFIGIDERPSFNETLELIFKIHPATKQIIAIHDDSITGHLNDAEFRLATAGYAGRAAFAYRSGKRLNELIQEVRQLQEGTIIVYFASFVPDATGKRISSIEALKQLSHASTAPIYGGWEFTLGHGIVGGRLVNLRQHGIHAAHLAVKVLEGLPNTTFKSLEPSPNPFAFDYNQLQRFKIPPSALPAGSIIINRPPTFFSSHGTALMAVLSACLLLLVILVFIKLAKSRRDLLRSQLKFATIFRTSPDLIAITERHTGRFLEVNDAFERVMGFAKEEVIGRTSLEIGTWGSVEDREQLKLALGQSSRLMNFKTNFRRKNGEVFTALVSLEAVPLEGTECFILSARDITDRIQMENALRERKARYRAMINAFEGFIYICSPDYRIQFMNERLIRRTGHDATGEFCYQALHDLDAVCAWCPNERVLAGETVQWEINSPKDGRWYQMSNTPVENADGSISKQAMITDITDRKLAEDEKKRFEQQFQQTQKLESLGVLAGGIAHDFNNILAIIIGYCSLVRLDYATAEHHIPEIEKAADRAAGLCRQMLTYAGKAQSIQSRFNLVTLVDEMVRMLASTISHNVIIKPTISPAVPYITGDPNQVRQVVMNLILNAAEAIGENKGEIGVSLTTVILGPDDHCESDHLGRPIPAGTFICLEVADNGCGMDEHTRLRLFEPFYTTKFTGRGLGMSAVLGILKSHQGLLQFTSKPGVGTIFKVYLPADTGALAKETARQDDHGHWQGSGTVLVAEDEDQLLLVLKETLEYLGFTPIGASNGREALALYQANADDIALVVTDIGMPFMDGYELCRELKKLNPKLPVIISSGFGDAVVSSQMINEDVAGMISKPYSLQQLQSVLKRVLEAP